MQYNTTQYNTIQCTIQYNVQYNTSSIKPNRILSCGKKVHKQLSAKYHQITWIMSNMYEFFYMNSLVSVSFFVQLLRKTLTEQPRNLENYYTVFMHCSTSLKVIELFFFQNFWVDTNLNTQQDYTEVHRLRAEATD